MSESETPEIQTSRFRRSAAESIRERSFPVAVRGYDRRAVDEFMEEMLELVTELEARQSREAVVQRALDEVGEETAGILQRAHETADEIAARSRAQAEGRIQRAEREADIVRRQADEFSEKVIVDTRLLWEERQRLIEDIRQLADEVLATADDAMERVTPPDPIADEPATLQEPLSLQPAAEGLPTEAHDAPTEVHDPPTAEVELDVLEGGAAPEEEDAPDSGTEPDSRP
jgi:DivIVA domain-containing protein